MNPLHVTLSLLPFDPSVGLDESLFDRLQSPQRIRADSLSGKRKVEFTLGRLLLDYAVENCLEDSNPGKPRTNWSVNERQGLPPVVSTENGPLTISISHSKGWLGVACSAAQTSLKLGLDIEAVRAEFKPGAANFFCNERQLEIVETFGSPETTSAYLTELWTQKEAFSKAYQQSVLSSKTKGLDFTDDPLAQLADLGGTHKLAVYCSRPVALHTQFLSINHHGKFKSIDPGGTCSLIWKHMNNGKS